MPDFDTPEPISVTLEFDMGTARIIAGKRADTVVEVLPTNGDVDVDVRAAQQTKVTYEDGRLLVKGPKKRSLFGKPGSLEVTVELPAGSDLEGNSPMADYFCEGPLGDCRLKTGFGDIRVDEAARANLRTSHGDIRVDRVAGDAELAAAGRLDVGEVGGAATVKNSLGETAIDEVTGDLKANSSNGRLTVGIAHSGVDARSANGAIRIGEVVRGEVALQVAAGDIEVGIRESTAAWLDVRTNVGSVRNSLGPAEGPGDSARTVQVRARTSVGDIIIRRP